jgi:hypothetical protein
MRFRLAAFGLHLLGSATALALIFGGLYLGWYRWPGWYLTGVVHVVAILAAVDLGLGPSLTAIVASPRKPRRELARDVGIIIAIQLIALAYGTVTLWRGRPLYYTFSVNRLELVQASDVSADEATRARKENLALAPRFYSRPRWVWAPLPENADEAQKIINDATFGSGIDVIDMPRYFKPWNEGLSELRPHLGTVAKLGGLTPHERARLVSRMQDVGIAGDVPNAMLLWSEDRRVLVVFHPGTLAIRTILDPD